MKYYEDANYVVMCELAKEIQQERDISLRDNYHNMFAITGVGVLRAESCKDTDVGYYLHFNDEVRNFDRRSVIWIPSLDQLQEKIYKVIGTSEIRITNFSDRFFLQKDLEDGFYAESIEQCYLMLLMKEKYNKTWDGGNWG